MSQYSVDGGEVTFTIDSTGVASFDVGGLGTAARGRFWAMSLVTAGSRDQLVRSEDQRPRLVQGQGSLRIEYDSLLGADGVRYPVALSVDVAGTDELTFTGEVTAREGVIVRDLSLPIVELAEVPAHEAAQEVLYRAEGLGRRISDPRTRLARAHTEYMRDDAEGSWELTAYPGELSMPWHGVQTGRGFLAMSRLDPEFSSVLLGSGVPGRTGPRELWLAAVTPVWHGAGAVPPVVVRRHAGGWRAAAQHYRDWARTWYHGPHPNARPIRGWQRIIMRHQFGEILFRYGDLVGVFEQGRAAGLDGLMLFGWWGAGFDRGYPTSYEPDEELGGAAELEAAIAEIRHRGGFVSLYANGNLIDRATPYARTEGAAVTKKDLSGLDHVVGYAFAGGSPTLRHFAPAAFQLACHGAPRWRERMAGVARTQVALGTDSVFFDQTAYHLAAWPCADTTHDHGSRATIEARYRALTLQGIREAAEGAAVGSEGMADCMIGALDFHHGWGFAFQLEDEAFPALFRTVFPEPIVSNRLLHDERAGWRAQLHYAFVHNLAFDVSIHRGRRTIAEYPGYLELVAELNAQRDRYGELFRRGTFELVEDDMTRVHVRYALDHRRLDIRWNAATQVWATDAGDIAPGDLLLTAGAVQ